MPNISDTLLPFTIYLVWDDYDDFFQYYGYKWKIGQKLEKMSKKVYVT